MAPPGGSSGSMGDVEAPLAEAPAAPDAIVGQLTGGIPSFSGCASELESLQAAVRQLQEASSTGRRLMFIALQRLHRSDVANAHVALDSAEKLLSPQAAAGPELWMDRGIRLKLCEASGWGVFAQAQIGCRGLLSFLEKGVLTPEMPECLRIGVEDVDDERYLIGTIEAAKELERYAVNRGQALDLPSIRTCLAAMQSLEQALMQFDFRNSEVRRRFDSIKYAVKKLETLVYEVDLARKRAEAAGQDVGGEPQAKRPRVEAAESEQPKSTASVVNLAVLKEIKERYDHFDSLREQMLKRSRDVLKGAKGAIFALQRDDLQKADTMLNQCAKDAGGIYKELIARSPSLRVSAFGAALEELAEALAYRAFRREKRLLGMKELQEASGLPFSFTVQEYLGGLMDLTGEVARFAVRSASRGRQGVEDVELSLACVDAVYTGLQELPQLPHGLGKKMGTLKGTLTKIEGILYELALLSRGGLSVKAPALEHEAKARGNAADDGDGD